ncbi:arylamine N-acetyltransferase family protein [Alteraurantiacibacter aquimixticola]|uniref:Arylamine N-acetyltransferase n=1 Tax=Alteraurantiacibacter aquimixticola TaxID=2489173 RepID=A0A4T3EYS4_9SPHN|nr:arylamine N-acetyltransferase [Alteraurantiacibacter aquimixticola]TIX49241.1 arylamine N-acetyltransferase [Alteraurantiacibacter aquimixticola]
MNARLHSYCQRIGLDAPPPPTPEGLDKVQAAHRQAITFENIDVLLGKPIAIDGDAAFAKLVERGRGGYCFEQNRLYADMLAAIGIATRPLLARPRLAIPEGMIPPRTHVLLLAEFSGEPWIADAGFGGSYVPPLPLQDGAVTTTGDGARHRLRRIFRPDGEWVLERAGSRASTDGRALDHADWQAQYTFDLAHVEAADLEQANHWTANWPQSRFRLQPIVSLVLPDGFMALSGRSLSIARGGEAEKREIASDAEWREVMQSHFGIALTEDDVARIAP